MSTESYLGLPWTIASQIPTRMHGKSPSTLMGYEIDFQIQTAIQAWGWMPGRDKNKPAARILIGRFRNLELAVLACEWHDYRHARSIAEQQGTSLLFVGSESVSALALDLSQEGEADQDATGLLDALIDDHICPNGRPFRKVASYFEAKKTALKQNTDGQGPFTLSLQLPAKDVPLWLIESPLGNHMVLGAVPVLAPDQEDHWLKRASEAFTRIHLLPQDPSFQEWMATRYDKWGLLATAGTKDSDSLTEATLETLKRLLGIAKRRDLHTDRDAIEHLERLDREYYKDMARGHGIYVPEGQRPSK